MADVTTVTPGNAIVTYHVIVTKATCPLRNGNADFHSTADTSYILRADRGSGPPYSGLAPAAS